LNDATDTTNKRVEVLDVKIKNCEKELLDYKGKLKAARPGPAQANLKKRALAVLNQKRMYERQRDQLQGMAWNMEQMTFATENIKTAQNTAEAMKASAGALKAEMGNIDIGEIEDTADDIADLLEDANEINDVLGRSYAVEDDIDEADLDDELAALDEQLAFEAELGDTDAPSYLTDTATPAVAADTPAPAAAEQVDEFGLPMSA